MLLLALLGLLFRGGVADGDGWRKWAEDDDGLAPSLAIRSLTDAC